jgi:hypothetical protein
MARKKKRRQAIGEAQGPRWQWFTFPVLAAFTAGGIVVLAVEYVSFRTAGNLNAGFAVAFYVFLALAGFVLSHLVFSGLLRSWIMRRRTPRPSAVPVPPSRQSPPSA